MSVSIMEGLQNAEVNLSQMSMPIYKLGLEQLHNAVRLLEKGYDINTQVEPLLEEFGEVEKVPDLDSY